MLGKNLHLSDITGNAALVGSPMNFDVDTVVLSGVCMTLILVAGSIVANKMVVEGPGGKGQGVVEAIYGFCNDLAQSNIGPHYKTFFPLIAAIFTFVLAGNFIGVFPYQFFEGIAGGTRQQEQRTVAQVRQEGINESAPKHAKPLSDETNSWWPTIHIGGEPEPWEWASPTTDFNVTCGLAAVALLTYLGSGFWKHKEHFFKIFFFSPMSWVEWLDTIIRPSTLALRLMVVITADELMRGAFLMICPMVVPAGIMGFELFIGVIQALVFALLTSVYIGLTVAEHH
jgi:F-type H+-transporting ATPase subunit a